MRLNAGDRQDDRWKRARVWIDGVEVTARCFMADDDRGTVGLFVRDAAGRLMRDGWGQPQTECLRGVVRILVDGVAK